MDKHVAYVPAALLLDRHLTPTTKVLWMVLQLCPDASLAELEARTGLSRPTLRKGLAGPAARLRPPPPPFGPPGSGAGCPAG